MATEFSNVGAGEEPYWQPSAGFGPGDHALADDYSVAWWNASPALAPLAPQSRPGFGSWCYVQRGARYRIGTYPAELSQWLLDPTSPCR